MDHIRSVRVVCIFYSSFYTFSFFYVRVYIYKCKHFLRFQSTRTNLIIVRKSVFHPPSISLRGDALGVLFPTEASRMVALFNNLCNDFATESIEQNPFFTASIETLIRLRYLRSRIAAQRVMELAHCKQMILTASLHVCVARASLRIFLVVLRLTVSASADTYFLCLPAPRYAGVNAAWLRCACTKRHLR